jgi:hypothetical protein
LLCVEPKPIAGNHFLDLFERSLRSSFFDLIRVDRRPLLVRLSRGGAPGTACRSRRVASLRGVAGADSPAEGFDDPDLLLPELIETVEWRLWRDTGRRLLEVRALPDELLRIRADALLRIRGGDMNEAPLARMSAGGA